MTQDPSEKGTAKTLSRSLSISKHRYMKDIRVSYMATLDKEGITLFEICNKLVLGRYGAENDISFKDPLLSGKHLQFFLSDDHPFVMDLESKNKSFLNGRELPPKKARKLYEYDVLEAGGLIFIHLYEDEISAEEYRALVDDALVSKKFRVKFGRLKELLALERKITIERSKLEQEFSEERALMVKYQKVKKEVKEMQSLILKREEEMKEIEESGVMNKIKQLDLDISFFKKLEALYHEEKSEISDILKKAEEDLYFEKKEQKKEKIRELNKKKKDLKRQLSELEEEEGKYNHFSPLEEGGPEAEDDEVQEDESFTPEKSSSDNQQQDLDQPEHLAEEELDVERDFEKQSDHYDKDEQKKQQKMRPLEEQQWPPEITSVSSEQANEEDPSLSKQKSKWERPKAS